MGEESESGNHARLFLAGENFPSGGSTRQPVPFRTEHGSRHEGQDQPSILRRGKPNHLGDPFARPIPKSKGPFGQRFEVDPVGTEVHDSNVVRGPLFSPSTTDCFFLKLEREIQT